MQRAKLLFQFSSYCSEPPAGFLAQHCKEDAHTNISKPPLKCFYISQHYQYYWFIQSDLPQPGHLQNWDLINMAHFQLISLLPKFLPFNRWTELIYRYRRHFNPIYTRNVISYLTMSGPFQHCLRYRL